MPNREVLIGANLYGVGTYGSGLYGSFTTIKIDNSWTWKTSINGQSTLKLKVIESDIDINAGYEIKLYVDDVLEFGGIVSNVEDFEEIPNYLYYKLDVTDYTILCDKRRIGEVFENKNAGYIINYIIDNYLVDEGISAGVIHDGITFDRINFDYKSATDCFNYLVDICTGYNWKIDKNKQIHFIAKSTDKCVTEINDSFIHYDFMRTRTIDNYSNIVYIEGGRKQTLELPDYTPSPKPDGKSRDFTLKFPLALEPEIEVNIAGGGWTSQTVGINGIDTGKKWYWTYGSKNITHDSSEAVLTDADDIRVTFTGLTDVRMIVEDTEKINDMVLLQANTTGKYENSYSDNSIVSNSTAFLIGKSYIEKNTNLDSISLYLENDLGDIEINKLIKVVKPLYGIDDWYLVDSITATDFNADIITYELKLISGESLGGWEKYFKYLLTQSKNISNEDVFVQSKAISESWSKSAENNIYVATPLYVSETLYVLSDGTIGTLVTSDTIND